MSACKTVRIASEAHAEYGWFVEINESDYDTDKHELFAEGAEGEGDKPRRGRPAKAKE